MKSFLLAVCLSCSSLLLFSSTAIASTEDTANTEITKLLEQAIHENVKQMKAENIEGTMATIHTKSNLYASSKSLISRLFDIYELDYEIIDIKFIAHQDELAYVRVKQLTKKVTGPAFKNNELDMVQIFKQEDGKWKIWSQANMSVVFLDQ
ncbi:hypothetical protein OO007_06285 [Cocleimonas sp. KMM 6892]|uniref:hypothetical protein n=1 Tax=unclassified Cocleimonas TaxID=2639732 RepID=UPI002DB8D39E|nr:MULTISPECIES: hypothetical protein [unclassified Cocleimonas]MEB8431829.1 hypothetical protein [Cocleimonas sp. KMM 6892]MEC4715085.1 hypothetical protein [Cocleimonas sp. KMM 6895]MEC4744101.1 hypothetical protein [Cocleimonas sp. KMM 6896]